MTQWPPGHGQNPTNRVPAICPAVNWAHFIQQPHWWERSHAAGSDALPAHALRDSLPHAGAARRCPCSPRVGKAAQPGCGGPEPLHLLQPCRGTRGVSPTAGDGREVSPANPISHWRAPPADGALQRFRATEGSGTVGMGQRLNRELAAPAEGEPLVGDVDPDRRKAREGTPAPRAFVPHTYPIIWETAATVTPEPRALPVAASFSRCRCVGRGNCCPWSPRLAHGRAAVLASPERTTTVRFHLRSDFGVRHNGAFKSASARAD